MPIKPDHLTDISDVLTAQATNGEVFVTVGDAVDGQGWGANAAMWGPDGYIAVPNQATQGAACRAIYLVDGNMKRVFACRDNRIANRAGTLAPGDRAIVTDASARVRVLQAANSVELYSEGPTAAPVQVLVDGPNDQVVLLSSQANSIVTGENVVSTAGVSSVQVNGTNGVIISSAGALLRVLASGDIIASSGLTQIELNGTTGAVTVSFSNVPTFQVTAGAPLGAVLPVMVSVAGVPTPSTKVYALL